MQGVSERLRLRDWAPIGIVLLASAALFWYASGFRVRIAWDIIDIAIGRNLLAGRGFVDFPGAPPALWRNPLAPLVAGVLVQFLPEDPIKVFRVIYTLGLSGATVILFLIGRSIGGSWTGVFAAVLFAMSPAVLTHVVGLAGVENTITQPLIILFYLGGLYAIHVASRTGSVATYAAAGVLFGLAFLARSDGLLYLGAAVVWCAVMWLVKRTRGSVLVGLATMLGVFLIVVSPWLFFVRSQSGKTQINAQAFYAFYASEGIVRMLPGDAEQAGYELATSLYGTPEENSYNIVTAISHNPTAFQQRLATNVVNYWNVLRAPDFLPIVAIATVALGFAVGIREQREWTLLLCLAAAVNLVYLAFEPDPRYVTHSVPVLVLFSAIGLNWARAQLIWVGTVGRRRTAAVVLGTAASIALAASWIAPVATLWAHAPRTVSQPERAIGEIIRMSPGFGESAIIRVDDGGVFGSGVFGPTIGYFARTRYSWGGSDAPGGYPRSTIFSMVSYPRVDFLISGADVYYSRGVPSGTKPIARYQDPTTSNEFFIVDVSSTDNSFPPQQPVLLYATDVQADRAACSPASAGLVPDGHPDLVLRLQLRFPAWPALDRVKSIGLERLSGPPGFLETQGTNFALGVAETSDGPLLNNASGLNLDVPGGIDRTLWLFGCQDVPDARSFKYAAHVYLDGTTELVSPPTTLAP
jgi:hypothetical protein